MAWAAGRGTNATHCAGGLGTLGYCPREWLVALIRLVELVATLAIVWSTLLIALGRGVFVIPRADTGPLAKKAARLTFLAGIPCFFLLSMAAGELTHLIPRPARALSALAMSLLLLPVYSILITVAVVDRDAQAHRRQIGVVGLLGGFVVVLILLMAAVITLSAILSNAGQFFAP
jgi:hypothetical protein